jgi:hypothetical protein
VGVSVGVGVIGGEEPQDDRKEKLMVLLYGSESICSMLTKLRIAHFVLFLLLFVEL